MFLEHLHFVTAVPCLSLESGIAIVSDLRAEEGWGVQEKGEGTESK